MVNNLEKKVENLKNYFFKIINIQILIPQLLTILVYLLFNATKLLISPQRLK